MTTSTLHEHTALLTLDDIAAKWRCTYRHARDVLTKKSDFPKPAPGSTSRRPKWHPGRIESYLLGNDDKTAGKK